MELNSDIKHFTCLLRKEYLYNLEAHHGEYELVTVFGICSIPKRALMFHVMTERGAQFGRLPISALCWKECNPLSLDVLQLWACFSYDVACMEYSFLANLRCWTRLLDTWVPGTYIQTIDWFGNEYAEDAGDSGWKCAHMIKLDDGNFALQPNNRILWREPSFITKPINLGERPDYKTNTHNWYCERDNKQTEDSDRYFYDLLKEQNGSSNTV